MLNKKIWEEWGFKLIPKNCGTTDEHPIFFHVKSVKISTSLGDRYIDLFILLSDKAIENSDCEWFNKNYTDRSYLMKMISFAVREATLSYFLEDDYYSLVEYCPWFNQETLPDIYLKIFKEITGEEFCQK